MCHSNSISRNPNKNSKNKKKSSKEAKAVDFFLLVWKTTSNSVRQSINERCHCQFGLNHITFCYSVDSIEQATKIASQHLKSHSVNSIFFFWKTDFETFPAFSQYVSNLFIFQLLFFLPHKISSVTFSSSVKMNEICYSFNFFIL